MTIHFIFQMLKSILLSFDPHKLNILLQELVQWLHSSSTVRDEWPIVANHATKFLAVSQ